MSCMLAPWQFGYNMCVPLHVTMHRIRVDEQNRCNESNDEVFMH